MNCGNPFLKTLKRIGYNEADYLDDSDFDFLSSEKKIKCFLDVFSLLNEKNVLTSEEIEEYSALTSAELTELERLVENGKLVTSDVEYEQKKEILFMQEQLTHIESHNKSIERQIEIFKKHEEDLLEEKEIQQNSLIKAKKKFQIYEMTKVTQAEEEFVSNLKSILEIAQDLEDLIVHSDVNDSKVPTSNFFKDIVQQYLDAEEKILQCVNTYLENNFQMQENSVLTFIIDENSHKKELMTEATQIKKMLKGSMNEKALNEKVLQKQQSIVKYFETTGISTLNCHSSQLRYKLNDALKTNEQLIKREEELETFLSDTISQHVDALLNEVDSCATNEIYNNLQFCIEKMSLPMITLTHQRARLEMLIVSLSNHKAELQNIKKLIQTFLSQIKQEQSYLQHRKNLIENEKVETAESTDNAYLEMVLSSLNKILTISDDFSPEASIEDVVQKADKFFEAKENAKKKQEEKMKTIDSVEKYAHSIESLLNCTGKDYSNWHELQKIMNANLNNLNIKLTAFEENITECSKDFEQKQKLLERKGNLRLARNLFVYGLMNVELFKKHVDDVKIAIENSADYNSTQSLNL